MSINYHVHLVTHDAPMLFAVGSLFAEDVQCRSYGRCGVRCCGLHETDFEHFFSGVRLG